MRASLSVRVFIALLLAVVPPLLVGVVADAARRSILQNAGAGWIAAAAVAVAVVWALILTVIYSRILASEVAILVGLATRGSDPSQPPRAEESANAYGRLAGALAERNRQVALLAAEAQAAPISGDPRAVAAHVVRLARLVTGDPTWTLALVRSSVQDRLPAGVYDDQEGGSPSPIGDLERWASVAERTEEAALGRARRLDGPWGAFVVVDVTAGAELTAVLSALWEGRADPSEAELDLLSLLGQHAGTALEHALLYAQVRSQADEIDRMADVQADFLRGVSHDLQTPLTSIRALASELQALPGLDAAALTDLDVIGHQADRLRRMVGQLLVVSRLEAGALLPRQEIFRPEPIIRRTWDALRADRPFALESGEPSLLLVADPDRVEQALWGVLDNAVKYSGPQTPVAVTVRLSRSSGMAEIAVTDQGIGMDPETAARTFDQFYRSDRARALVPDGSGIGLYAVRGIVEAMGGSVRVRTAPDAGTTLVLTLPAETAEPTETPV
ncbi:MAG: GAF domain-containing sensor histidine kinase [Chloroflexota bacterium]|nr:GAF domain-containing sensor histidine kinase [Chloroflexota bacterium]